MQLADIAGAHQRCRTNVTRTWDSTLVRLDPGYGRAQIPTFQGLLCTYWRSEINGTLDLASNDGAIEMTLVLAGPVG